MSTGTSNRKYDVVVIGSGQSRLGLLSRAMAKVLADSMPLIVNDGYEPLRCESERLLNTERQHIQYFSERQRKSQHKQLQRQSLNRKKSR